MVKGKGRDSQVPATAKKNGNAGHPDWPATRPELWALEKIVPYPRNPRSHPPEEIAALAADMVADGVTMPILVDEAGVIIAGHGRLAAAAHNQFRQYPVVVARGWTEAQKQSARIRDNQRTLQGAWNAELLKMEIGDLKLAGYDVPLLGFPETQLRSFGIALGNEGSGDPEATPERPKNPVSRRGDLWLLGNHRLLCGDATSESDVAMCLGGAKPHLMVTDSPYGVDYDANWRNEAAAKGSIGYGARAIAKVNNDDQIDWTAAWKLFPGNVAYCWHAGRHVSIVQASLETVGLEIVCQIIWAKPRFVISRGDYHWQHEPCWYAVRKGKRHEWTGNRSQTTLWPINHQKSETGHSTQKPLECMKRPIENNSKAGDCVYEPFSGSGTTIIAAEMTKRKCLAIEIAPEYVDVAVLRWQKFTNKQATLESSGNTFEEVSASRRRVPRSARDQSLTASPG